MSIRQCKASFSHPFRYRNRGTVHPRWTFSLVVLGVFISGCSTEQRVERIVFTSDRIGYPQLYIMDSSGGTAIRATNSHGYCDSPAWSPDGDRIAYTARSGRDFHIFVMDADGSDQTRLTNNPTNDIYLCWSPDGSMIAFSSDRNGNWEIYVMNADGTNQTNLTNNPALGSGAEQLIRGLQRFEHQSHVVFYKSEPGSLLIIRVLHSSMDAPRHF